MINDAQIISLIFGFKVRYLRQKFDYSYQELSGLTGLSTSYLNDIEKGKKYPKPDKITALAEAFKVDYDYMVSTTSSKKLKPIIDLLNSKFLKIFPLDEFGISLEKLLELFTKTPDKVNAFISTIFKIARHYQVDEEHFYKEALRSYQDMHNNYFPEIEQAAHDLRAQAEITEQLPVSVASLEKILANTYNISINRVKLGTHSALQYTRSYYKKESSTLFIKPGLTPSQEKFIMGRELGFQYLKLKERPFENRMLTIDSFEKILNNFKASYFSAALIMDEHVLVKDIRTIARASVWKTELITDLIKKYEVTPEMLMQRFTSIFPHHFDIEDIFFLRLSSTKDLSRIKMTKELHLSQLHNPYNNELNEHYCNKWIAVNVLKGLRVQKFDGVKEPFLAGAQISTYYGTDRSYFCVSIAKPAFHNKEKSASVTMGMLINSKSRAIINFLNDPNLKTRIVNTTCERCPIPDCEARVASPVQIERQEQTMEVKRRLEEL